MPNLEELYIDHWVNQAEGKPNKEFREAVHTILSAIASDKYLKASMILKGGILLAVRYQSHRFTKDIDLSTEKSLGSDIDAGAVVDLLNQSLSVMVETLNYDLDCIVQSCNLQPSNPDATYPSIKLTVGYAYKGTAKHKKLQARQSPTVVSIDYSLNEKTPNIDRLKIIQGDDLFVYSLTDLIAEKYRSLFQQVIRNRNRRQDVFDLYLILETFGSLGEVERKKILNSLIEKARSRGVEVSRESFDNPEIKERARHDYHTLAC